MYSNSSMRRGGYSRPAPRGVAKHRARRVLFNALASLLILASLLFFAAGVVLNMHPFESTGGGQLTPAQKSALNIKPIVPNKSKDVVSFLVTGVDDYKNTDIIMYLSWDIKKNQLNILQIPRDTYIGNRYDPPHKLNEVFQSPKPGETNAQSLMSYVSNELGLPIDQYIIVNTYVLPKIVDDVDGVDVYVPKAINGNIDGDIMDHIPAGMNHFNGSQANGFMHYRSGYDMGDLGRLDAQRNLYQALFEKLMTVDVSQLLKIAQDAYGMVQTDMSIGEMLGMVQLGRRLSLADVYIYMLPGQTVDTTLGGTPESYYSIHKDEYVTMANEHFLPYSDPITAAKVTVPENYKTFIQGSYTKDGSLADTTVAGGPSAKGYAGTK